MFFHIHKFSDSAVNKWQISHEQKCRCGQYRHRYFSGNNLRPDEWILGEHPTAEKLRLTGEGIKTWIS